MKLIENNSIEDQLEQVGDFEGGKVGLDTKNMGLFFEIASKAIYSDPKGSIVRELTSNCFDSHAEAGVKRPVVVKCSFEEDACYISFEDFGVGISPDRFRNIYLNYLSSTKRDSNEYLGTWGLGSKSPFSYTDQFEVRTRFDGTEYHYMLYKGANGTPDWTLLYSIPTEECNGSLVKFIIEGGKFSHDWFDFQKAIKHQLRYFDDVYVEGFDVENEYQIFDYQTFKFRKGLREEEMHICYGKVVYPIDWEIIDIPAINIPVGVKFEIGELDVTPSREALRYNPELIKLIQKRVKGCLKELEDLAKNATYTTLEGILKAKKEYQKVIKLTDEVTIPVYEGNYGWDDKKREYIRYYFEIPKPRFKPFGSTPIDIPDDPFFIFRTVGTVKGGSYFSADSNSGKAPRGLKTNNVYILSSQTKLYRTKEFKLKLIKAAYINEGAVVGFNKGIGFKTILRRIGLQDNTRTPFNHRIKEEPVITDKYNKLKLFKLYKKVMTEELIKRSESYDNLIIPKEFEDGWKNKFAKRRIKVADEDIAVERIGYDNGTKVIRKLSNLKNGLIVYSSNKDKGLLTGVHHLLSWRENAKACCIAINLSDFKKMENRENTIEVNDLMSKSSEFRKKHQVLIEQTTAFYLYRRYANLKIGHIIEYIPSIKRQWEKLNDFINKATGGYHYRIEDTIKNKFVQEILTTAKEEGLILKEYEELVNNLEKIEEDLKLVNRCADKVQSFEDKQDIAAFIIKKGYPVYPEFVFKLTKEEKQWVEFWYKHECLDYPKAVRKTQEELRKEMITFRNNRYSSNYSPYNPSKEWQVNFHRLKLSELVEI